MVPDIASAYRSRMKVADLSSQDEVAIFEKTKAGIEEAGIALHNKSSNHIHYDGYSNAGRYYA